MVPDWLLLLAVILLIPGGSGILLKNSFEHSNIFLELFFHRFPQQLLRDMEEVGRAGLNGYVDPCPATDVLEDVGCPEMNRPAQGLETIFFVRLEFCDFKGAQIPASD